MLIGMDAVGLPARVTYAILALPLGGAAGFYSGMWLLPKLVGAWRPDSSPDGYTFFTTSIAVGVAVACAASLVALTLPWKRHRNRHGRTGRIVLSGLFVVIASVIFAAQEHGFIIDLAFAAWLAYFIAFTYVRYGVRDRRRSRASSEVDLT